MNSDIVLSKDLKQIEVEIELYKEQAGRSIWEIGRRLIHVKEFNLVHGEFGNWLRQRNISLSEANKMMRVARELPYNSKLSQLGLAALNLIVSLPEASRDVAHQINGVSKLPNEMSVQELKQVKQEIKVPKFDAIESNTRVYDAHSNLELNHRENSLELTANHVKSLEEDLLVANQKINELKQRYQEVLHREEKTKVQNKQINEIQDDINRLIDQRNQYQLQNRDIRDYLEFKNEVNQMIIKLSPLKYQSNIDTLRRNPALKRHYLDIVTQVQKWCSDMCKHFDTEDVIDVQVIEVHSQGDE